MNEIYAVMFLIVCHNFYRADKIFRIIRTNLLFGTLTDGQASNSNNFRMSGRPACVCMID